MSSELLVVTGNPRKKKRRAKPRAKVARRRRPAPAAVPAHRKRRYGRVKRVRRRRNPRRGGGFKFMGIDVLETAGGAAIASGGRLLSAILGPRFGLSATGVESYATQLVAGLGLSWAIENFLGQRGIAQKGFEYTLVNLMQRGIDDYVLDAAGLGSWLGQYLPGTYDVARPTFLESAVGPTFYDTTIEGSVFGEDKGRFRSRFGS